MFGFLVVQVRSFAHGFAAKLAHHLFGLELTLQARLLFVSLQAVFFQVWSITLLSFLCFFNYVFEETANCVFLPEGTVYEVIDPQLVNLRLVVKKAKWTKTSVVYNQTCVCLLRQRHTMSRGKRLRYVLQSGEFSAVSLR